MNNIINTSLRDEAFLARHSENVRPEELYLNVRYYVTKYNGHVDENKIEHIGNCLWYLKRLISVLKPEDCIKMIYEIEGMKFHPSIVESSYIYLTYLVADIKLWNEDYQEAAHWSKKTIELFDYFHPEANASFREYVLKKNGYYNFCMKTFLECRNYFSWEIHSKVLWDWEKEQLIRP